MQEENTEVNLEQTENENSNLVTEEVTNKNLPETDASDKDKKTDNQNDSDLYSYLNRDEFTSEKFKIEVRELPKYYGITVSQSF